MRPFEQKLLDSYADTGLRPMASEALGAVLLDAAGVTPDEIEKKRTILHVPDVNAITSVTAALFRIYRDRATTKPHFRKVIGAKESTTGMILLLEDMDAMTADWWMAAAGERGIGVVFTVSDGATVDPEVKAWADREVTLDETDAQPIIPDVIRLVTREGFVVRENDCQTARKRDPGSACKRDPGNS